MLNLLADGGRNEDATEVSQELEGFEFVEMNERSGVADNGCCLSRSHAGPTRRPCARTRP